MKRLTSVLLALVLAAGIMAAGVIPAAAATGQLPGDWFATADEAALGFAMAYMPLTLIEGVEYGATIYRTFNWDDFRLGYTYSIPHKGDEYSVSVMPPSWLLLFPFLLVGDVHTHPRGGGDDFSEWDIVGAHIFGFVFWCYRYIYVVTPGGLVRRYDMRTRQNQIVYSGLVYRPARRAAEA